MDVEKSLEILRKSEDIMKFLETDMKNSGEIGAMMDYNGNIKNIKVGNATGVSVESSDNTMIGIHTHPFLSGTKISDQDLKSTNYPNIEASIILSMEMFETEWNGVCFTCENMEIVDRRDFRIICEGSTSGPSEERYIEKPKFRTS